MVLTILRPLYFLDPTFCNPCYTIYPLLRRVFSQTLAIHSAEATIDAAFLAFLTTAAELINVFSSVHDGLKQALMLATLLLRPFALYNNEAALPNEAFLTKEKYGSVHRVYIICDQDKVIKRRLSKVDY
ncbi:hypothetical protein SLEP1_g11947 [Rubroshorea leprosula]|nr:hypothetical protein SLEP1_g11947 [Rubroshorea leprosula]